jgi:hypothetical protein
MTFLEGMKFQPYLIYSLPFLSAITATAGGWLWINRWVNHRRTRVLLVAAILALTLPQIRNVLSVIRRNPARNELGYVASYLRTARSPGDVTISGAELGYELGFNDALRDDVRLGYATGLRPRFIVTSGWYRLWFEGARSRDPALYNYIHGMLDRDYQWILTRGEYRIYGRATP